MLILDKTSQEGDTLQKATITLKTFQFDAFRPAALASFQFQPAVSCSVSSNSSDLVPIVVGCGLAGLVLFILVSYLVGRRAVKVPAKGYATV